MMGWSMEEGDCERCQNEGFVITYKGKPLWMGPTMGAKRLLEIARGDHMEVLRSCEEHKKAMQLYLAAKFGLNDAFEPVLCPDCEAA